MDINNFVSIAVVGSLLSLFIQWLKSRWGTESYTTKLATIFSAILVGTVYYFLVKSVYYEAVLGVLAASSTFYALFLKK